MKATLRTFRTIEDLPKMLLFLTELGPPRVIAVTTGRPGRYEVWYWELSDDAGPAPARRTSP